MHYPNFSLLNENKYYIASGSRSYPVVSPHFLLKSEVNPALVERNLKIYAESFALDSQITEHEWEELYSEETGCLSELRINLSISNLFKKRFGYITMSMPLNGDCCSIEMLHIYKNFRGQGLGTLLLQTALHLSALNGISKIVLYSTPNGIPTYIKNGFCFVSDSTPINIKKTFYKGITEHNNSIKELKSKENEYPLMSIDLVKNNKNNLNIINNIQKRYLYLSPLLQERCLKSIKEKQRVIDLLENLSSNCLISSVIAIRELSKYVFSSFLNKQFQEILKHKKNEINNSIKLLNIEENEFHIHPQTLSVINDLIDMLHSNKKNFIHFNDEVLEVLENLITNNENIIYSFNYPENSLKRKFVNDDNKEFESDLKREKFTKADFDLNIVDHASFDPGTAFVEFFTSLSSADDIFCHV